MSKRNKNRPGYKKTRVGWIPEEWDRVSLRDVCSTPLSGFSVMGGDRPAKESQHGVLKLSCIQNGRFVPGENKVVLGSGVAKLKTSVRADTLLISRSNTDELVGAVCYVPFSNSNLYLSDLLWEVSTNNSSALNMIWLTYLLCSRPYRTLIGSMSNGTSGSMKKITKPSFLAIHVPLPPLPEQKKIAEILSTWDAAIDQTRKLIDAKKRRKKALMQQLLTGKKRLPGFNGGWKEYNLGDLFDERREGNHDTLPLLAITGSRGVIPASEIDRKDASSENKSKYKRIKPGDIGYNTMRMWQGVSALSELEGIVSPAYTVCIPKKGTDVRFMGFLFKYPPMVHVFWRYSQGMVSDTLNLKFHSFSQIGVRVPSLNEQCSIAEVLQATDSEIMILEKKLAALEKQKRGLMQKLLTGEVRVRV